MNTYIKDYYAILGISKNATQDEIKRAFRDKAKKYHPDVCKEPDAHERFIEIGEAYEILSNPETRREYDEFLARAQNNSYDYYDYDTYSDFEDAQRRAQDTAETYAGMDLEDLIESVLGFAYEMGRTVLVGERGKPKLTLWEYVKLGFWGIMLLFGAILTFTGAGTIPGILLVKYAYDVTQKDGKFLGIVPLVLSTLGLLFSLLFLLILYMRANGYLFFF